MLALSRKLGTTIVIGPAPGFPQAVTIHVGKIGRKQVQIAIEADRSIPISRGEILHMIPPPDARTAL
jgi:carbon storage regulator CsrA